MLRLLVIRAYVSRIFALAYSDIFLEPPGFAVRESMFGYVK